MIEGLLLTKDLNRLLEWLCLELITLIYECWLTRKLLFLGIFLGFMLFWDVVLNDFFN